MENYKNYIISKGGIELGLLFSDIQEYLLTPEQYRKFSEFMRGQTCGVLVDMSVCYTGDYIKFINQLT